MKFVYNRSPLSHLVVIVLTVAVFATQTMFVFATPGSASVSGEVTVTGPAQRGEKPFVFINGDPAFSGRTFFSNGTIATTDTSSGTVDFGKVGRIVLAPGSTLSLNVSATAISGTLSAGTAQVSNSAGVVVRIETPTDVVTTENNDGASFAINVAAEGTSVTAERGVVRYNNGLSVAGAQDDDDHNEANRYWIPVIVAGAAVGGLILYLALRDEETVSPVR